MVTSMDGLEKCVRQALEELNRLEQNFVISYERDIVPIKNQVVLVGKAVQEAKQSLEPIPSKKVAERRKNDQLGNELADLEYGELDPMRAVCDSLFTFSGNSQSQN
jgi:hypothetical protein